MRRRGFNSGLEAMNHYVSFPFPATVLFALLASHSALRSGNLTTLERAARDTGDCPEELGQVALEVVAQTNGIDRNI
jgi:hypothetical protein